MKHELLLHVDHGQFYLADVNYDSDTSAIWEAHALEELVATLPDIIAVSTMRLYGDIKVSVEIHVQSLLYTLEPWDHVVKCSLAVGSNAVMVFAPETSYSEAPSLPIEPGIYTVLIFYENMAQITDETALTGNDTYHLLLWPGDAQEVQVLKQFK